MTGIVYAEGDQSLANGMRGVDMPCRDGLQACYQGTHQQHQYQNQIPNSAMYL